MKVYFGIRTEQGCKVFSWDTLSPARPEPLDLALHLWNHSPDGFEWGYNGSGPAQLALALLLDCTEDATFAVDLHQRLKEALVVALPKHVWARNAEEILRCAMRVSRTQNERLFAARCLAMVRNGQKARKDVDDGN